MSISDSPELSDAGFSPRQLARRRADRIARYREQPAEAWTVDSASTSSEQTALTDPTHTSVEVASGFGVELPISLHENLGGPHDQPTPGDMLCAALASCMDQTLRSVATSLGVHIEALRVEVHAEVDVRGTLGMARDVPVGFQRLRVELRTLKLDSATDPRLARKLVAAAEHCCIVLATLRAGVPVDVTLG